jgi:hypothetical protein
MALSDQGRGMSLNPENRYYVTSSPNKRDARPTSPNPSYKEQQEKASRMKNKEILDPLTRSREIAKETRLLYNSDVGFGKKAVGTVFGGTGIIVGLPLVAAQQFIKSNIKFEEGQVYLGTDLLVAGGTIVTSVRPGGAVTTRQDISSKEKVRFNKQFDSFLKKENIGKNQIVTQEDALKIQEFALKYNRENQATAVKIRSDTRLVKQGRVKEGQASRDLNVELKLKPVERIEIYGETKNLGRVQTENRYMIVKKGKAEFVDLSKLDAPDVVYLQGKQSIFSKSFKKPDAGSSVFIEDKSGVKLLPGGNLGSLSKQSQSPFSVSRNVKDVVSAKTFGEQLGVKSGVINVDDFIGRLDSVDLSGAKIFKLSGVRRGKNFGTGSVFERTSLNVRGEKIKLGGEARAGSNFKRIGRNYPNKYNANQIEDQRFRLEYVDKKLLTASNIREVTEFDKGYYVKLYTYDTGARVFRNIEAFIPKTGGGSVFKSGVGGVTTASDIIKKNTPVSFGEGGVGGGEQVLVNPETIKVKTNVALSKVKVGSEGKSKTKSGVKTESPKMSYASPDSPKFYYQEGTSYQWGNKIYSPDGGYRARVRNNLNYLYGGLSFGRGDVSSLNRVASKPASAVISKPISDVASKPISGVVSKPMSAVASASASQQINEAVSQQVSVNRFKFDIKADDATNPGRKLPKFKLDFDKKDGGVFGVSVKRFGTFRGIGKGLTLGKALQLGSARVRGSAAATFQVTRGGKPISVGAPSGFYKKGASLIEQNKFRINTPGELKEITYVGIGKSRLR